MTPTQIREIVTLVYTYWNDRLPSTESVAKQVLTPWNRMLQDIEYETAKKAVDELAILETYMPKPSTVRIAAITIQNKIKHPPETYEAWATIQNLSKNLANGTAGQTEIHPLLKQTINQMGGMNHIGTTTNGDRTFFTDAYQKNVLNWLRETFAP
jgi:hypothetical protein